MSTPEERAARQRAADHDGKPGRIDEIRERIDRATDIAAARRDRPSPLPNRLDLGGMIERAERDAALRMAIPYRPVNPEPIPNLSTIPGRVKSHVVTVDELSHPYASEIMHELNEKIRAEDERLRRMLPEAPPGMEWRAELKWSEADSFEHFRREMQARIEYRLFDLRTGEDVFERWSRIAAEE